MAALGAWVNAVGGHLGGRRAVGQGRQPGPADGPGGVAPDVPLALLGAASRRDEVEQDGPRRGACSWRRRWTGKLLAGVGAVLLGIARLLAGDPDAADHHLADAAEVGRIAGIDAAGSWSSGPCWLTRGEWQQAETLAERAAAGARRAWLEQYLGSALLHAATARLAIHRGDVPGPGTTSPAPSVSAPA